MFSQLKKWAVIFWTLPVLVTAGGECNAFIPCMEGEKCDKGECQPCEYGTFREELSHKYEYCKPWSGKPAGGNWKVTKNGTATSDREWGCKTGYKIKRVTTYLQQCVKITLTAGTTEQTTSSVITSTSGPPVQASESGNKLSTWEVVGIIIGGCIVILCIFATVIYVWHRRKKRSTDEQRPMDEMCSNGERQSFLNGNAQHEEALTRLAHYLAYNLDAYIIEKFFVRLPTNSYPTLTRLSHHKENKSEFTQPYKDCFIEWYNENKKPRISTVTNTLIEIGQEDLTRNSEYVELCRRLQERNENEASEDSNVTTV